MPVDERERNLVRRMPGPLRHIGELAKARATKRSAERDDAQSLSELERRPLELTLSGGLPLRPGLGISIEVAGVRFYHQGSANLIDEAVRERGVDVHALRAAG
jgi:hypothetical protein